MLEKTYINVDAYIYIPLFTYMYKHTYTIKRIHSSNYEEFIIQTLKHIKNKEANSKTNVERESLFLFQVLYTTNLFIVFFL